MRILERRKYPRYGFQSDVELLIGSDVQAAFITDLSMGGMFIATTTPLHVGTACTARILLDPPLLLSCVVRRVIPGRGMGVSFEGLATPARARLEKVLVSLARS